MSRRKYYLQELNCRSYNLSAFTVWDMLVAMVITSLLVSVVYILFLKTNATLSVDEESQKKLEELIMFEKKMYYSFANSDFIYMDKDIIYFGFREYDAFLELNDTSVYYYSSAGAVSEFYHTESCNIVFEIEHQHLVSELELILRSTSNYYYPLYFKKYYSQNDLYKLEGDEY